MADIELGETIAHINAEQEKTEQTQTTEEQVRKKNPESKTEPTVDQVMHVDKLRSQVLAIMLSQSGLANVTSPEGHVVHSIEHTLIAKLYGVEKAKRAIQIVMSPAGMAFIGSTVPLGGVFLYVAFAGLIPEALFVAYCWILMPFVVFVHLILFDLRLVKVLCKQWVVWVVFLSSVGQNAALYGLMNYDWRAYGGFVFIMISNMMRSLVEATPSYYRVWLGAPGAIVLIVTNLLMLIFVNLNRFGNMIDVTYRLSLGELVISPAWTYALVDVFNFFTFILLSIYVKWLYHGLRTWRTLHLSSFTVTLLAEEDYAGREAAEWFTRVAMFAGVNKEVFSARTRV